MKVIVCIDDKKGMMFNNRRQSQDSAVRKDILETVENKKIWMNPYSAKQFLQLETENLSMIVDEDFIEKAGGDYCFVENISLKPYIKKIEEIIIYHWNRQYPADFYFDIDVEESDWEVISQKELVGTSHENIQKEIYIKKDKT